MERIQEAFLKKNSGTRWIQGDGRGQRMIEVSNCVHKCVQSSYCVPGFVLGTGDVSAISHSQPSNCLESRRWNRQSNQQLQHSVRPTIGICNVAHRNVHGSSQKGHTAWSVLKDLVDSWYLIQNWRYTVEMIQPKRWVDNKREF